MRKQAMTGGLLAGLLVAAGGCGGEPKTGEVTGTVKLDGKAVTAGTVSFQPKAGGVPVMAEIGPDGTYTALSVPVGDVLVGVQPPGDAAAGEVIKNRGKGGDAKGKAAPPPAPPPAVKFPPKYADAGASGLSVVVKDRAAEGQTTYDVVMTAK